MAVPEFLRTLLTAPGPSGYETPAAVAWREAAAAFAEVEGDVMGSSRARVAGSGGGPTLAIVGHIDEIGLIVTHVEDSGFLRFTGVGGWDPMILVGQRVDVLTRDGSLPGVVGKKPIHLLTPDDRKKVPELKELHIDIGTRDADESRSLVRIGDVAVIAAEPLELRNGRFASRAMDNRLGSYVAFEAARLVAEAGGAPGDVVAVAAVQEETTFGGSATTAFSLAPDLAIAVDVTHETTPPGIDVSQTGKHEFDSGPVISRGSNLHPLIFELLHEAAEAEGIEFTIEASGRHTGTDADAMHLARGGIPCGLVSVPLRYMHSPVELCSLADVDNAARLIAAFAQRLSPDISFSR